MGSPLNMCLYQVLTAVLYAVYTIAMSLQCFFVKSQTHVVCGSPYLNAQSFVKLCISRNASGLLKYRVRIGYDLFPHAAAPGCDAPFASGEGPPLDVSSWKFPGCCGTPGAAALLWHSGLDGG